jgi:adenylate cyclase
MLGSGVVLPMSKETEVAVLFADVVGSTRLYEVLGDHLARDMIVTCVEIMRNATERNRGSVIKTIGDEILAIFPTADDAVNAAGEMQHDIAGHPGLQVNNQHVAIRIGCHYGPVVLENRDIFGASVHTANRMTSQAKAGQIILTADTVQRLCPEWLAATRQIDVTPLRGRSEEVELFEVLWQQEDATSMLPSIEIDARTAHRPRRIRLRYQDREYVLGEGGEGKESLTLGRADDNDIVVKGNLISRVHAPHRDGAEQGGAGGPEHQRLVRHHGGGPGGVRAPRFSAPAGPRTDRTRPPARRELARRDSIPAGGVTAPGGPSPALRAPSPAQRERDGVRDN